MPLIKPGSGPVAVAVMAVMLGCNGGDAATGAGDTEAATDTDTGTGGTTGEALEMAAFFGAAEQAYCRWAAGCGVFATVEACEAVTFFDVVYSRELLASGLLDGFLPTGMAVDYLIAGYEAGRLTFDADAAATCLAYVEGRGCFEPGTFAPSADDLAGQAACAAIMGGTMVENGPCLLSLECAPQPDADVVCGFSPTCADACCLGGCRTLGRVPVGTPCNNQTRCAEGSYCARDPNTGLFTTCTARAPIGAACPNGNECVRDSFCNFDTGVCSALAGEGGACNWNGDRACQPGLYCADPEQIEDYRCYPYELLGGPCLDNWSSGCKQYGATCDTDTRTCVTLPEAGQPCQNGGCALTAICDWFDQVCVAKASEGEPCGDGIGCIGGLMCDGWDSEARCRRPEVTSVCPVPGEDQLPEGT